MGFLDTVLKSFLGDKNAKDLKEIKKVVDKIKKAEPAIEQLSDDELRGKLKNSKKKLQQLLKTSPNK
jgi:preprotein translocase subunit SecA